MKSSSPARPSPAKRARTVCGGYSLVELVAGLLIAGILVGAGNGAYRLAVEDARTTQALAELGAIVIAIEKFRVRENGRLPDSLAALGFEEPDPWGNPYRYTAPPGAGYGSADSDDVRVDWYEDFDVFSLGPDGLVTPSVGESGGGVLPPAVPEA